MMSLVCAEHYEHGPLVCCPFPGCSNGTDAEEIEATGPHLPTKTYRRVTWTLPGDDVCYSWREQDNPLWGQIQRVMWREAARSSLTERYSPGVSQVIYHYTSPEGLLGIVEKNEFWMSDYSFMNDAEELTYGLALAKQRFEKCAQALPFAADLLRKWGNPSDLSDLRVCVGSFSLRGDSLSQWRAYGSIAVGFEVGPLMFGYNNSVRMNRVIYEPEKQERFIDLMAHLSASAYAEDKKNLPAAEVARIYGIRGEGETLLEVTAFFKHPTFADEHEARIVHIEDRKVYESLKIYPTPQRFRVSGDILLPYLTTRDVATFPDKYPDKLPIVEIVIGPSRHAQVLERGVERLLAARGYGSVKVTRSTAPVRV
jgi:hypothetical protein